MKRSEAREKAFKIIFQIEFHEDFNEIYKRLMNEESLSGSQGEYALNVIDGVRKNKEILDGKINSLLKKGWDIKRLPNTVKAILRLAAYEILYVEDIPDAASINEAVSLAKKYCDEKDLGFINGILRNIQTQKEGSNEGTRD